MEDPIVGNIVEMDYQQNVAYVKGISRKKDSQKINNLIFIHPEWESQRHEWHSVARERLRYVGNRMTKK